MSRVDHSSHLPLYIQLIQHLSEEIERGTYKEEERIPPERALAAQFGVSRITVTSAIQKMVQEGSEEPFSWTEKYGRVSGKLPGQWDGLRWT